MSDYIDTDQEQVIDDRIPVSIITGFLGSGKTTLLNHWVRTPEFKDTLVLINEFGNVGLDHELVESCDESVVLLENGCICCTLQGELVKSLLINRMKALKGQIPNFNRVFIETTGLADPAGVIKTLISEETVLGQYRYDGTISLIDAQFVRKQLKEQYECVKQIAIADLALITKTDLIDADEIDAIYDIVHQINPTVKVIPVIKGNLNPNVLENIGPYKNSLNVDPSKVLPWMNVEGQKLAPAFRKAEVQNNVLAKPKIIAHTDIESFVFTHDEPIKPENLFAALNVVASNYGDSLLRFKGIINIEGEPKPIVVHGVQGDIYPLSSLDSWPKSIANTQLVFIVRSSVKEQIEQLFSKFIKDPDEDVMNYFKNMIAAAENIEEIDLNDAVYENDDTDYSNDHVDFERINKTEKE